MKNVFRIIATFLTVALLAVSFTATSQEEKNLEKKKHNFSPYWYVTANVGITNFWGDIQSNNFFQKSGSEYRISTGIFLGRQFTPVFGLRGNIQYGRMHSLLKENQDGTPADKVADAWHLYETTLQGTVDFTNLIGGFNPDRVLSVYGFLGLGLSNWESTAYHMAALRASGVTGIPTPEEVDAVAYASNGKNGRGVLGHTTEAIIPFGLGVSANLSDQFAIGLEQSFKPVNSDLLDANAGGFKYDVYTSTTLNVTYNFKDMGGGIKDMIKNHHLVQYESEKKILERHGDEVKVKIEGKFPPKYFAKKAAMKFVPVLKYGNKTKELKAITLRGEKVLGDGKVISNKNGGNFTYTDVIPFEEGMENAELVVLPVFYAPKGDPADNTMSDESLIAKYKARTLESDVKIADATIITPQRVKFIPRGSFADNVYHNAAMAPSGYQKVTVVSEQATIYFRVNKDNLNMWLPLNKNAQAKADLQKMKDFIERGWEIKDIDINAWASPEGEESFNEGLSERRAQTGLKYLTKYFKKLNKNSNSLVKIADPENDIKFNIYARGEDWNGFLNSVQKSNLKDKNIILNVVKSQPDLMRREQEIRNMTLVYKEIEDDILPPLRRVDFTVNLYEPKKSEAEISNLALNNPDALSIVELLYAGELTTNDDTRLKIYKTIMAKEPKCWKAKNNAAFIYMKKGELKKAVKLLEAAKKLNPQAAEVHNNLGLIAATNKEYAKAKTYFNTAARLGVNTDYNMGVIMITEGSYDKALSKMANKKCDYNVALAHISKGEISKAKAILNCAPETACNFYLRAVVEARNNNANGVYSNLTKAVQKCGKLKAQAKEDREFLNFFNEVDFQNILK